jgi:hypothetical protein
LIDKYTSSADTAAINSHIAPSSQTLASMPGRFERAAPAKG